MLTDKTRILIVEDESIVSKDIAISLANMDYDVAGTVTSAERALEFIAREQPDLVLMDIVLQGQMDGIEGATRIRSKFNIPVIYLTAYADEEMLERAKITEPFGYLIKPFEDIELHFSIQMGLYKHSMEMQREQLISELKDALAKIKSLKGLLPICAWCKKIRDDRGYWNQVETYIQQHSEAEFTHGMCPECQKRLESELDTIRPPEIPD